MAPRRESWLSGLELGLSSVADALAWPLQPLAASNCDVLRFLRSCGGDLAK